MKRGRNFVFMATFALLFTMFCSQPNFVLAEGASTIPSVSNASRGIDVRPIEGNRVTEGFKQMGNDIADTGQGMALPGFFGGLAISSVLMLLGIVSKRCLKAGGVGLIVSFAFLFLMGDPMTIGGWGERIVTTIRSYWN